MNSDFKDLLAALCHQEVRFLVVGGYAVMFHTEPRFTKALDIWEGRAEARIGSDVVPMIGLEELMKAKRSAGRPQDLLDLENLESAFRNTDGNS